MDITLVLVTLFSLVLAAVMTMLAWRLAREERRRSDARVAALAAEIHADLPLSPAPRAAIDLPLGAEETSGELFAAPAPARAHSRFAAVLASGVLLVGGTGALLVILSGPHATAGGATSVESGSSRTLREVVQPPHGDAVPLELVALTHERDADRLIVRGIVRNPDAGNDVTRLTVIVQTFDRDGGQIATGVAPVDMSTIAPGTEAPFTVTVAGVADIGKYRVSFRTDDHLVPHVDRRDRAMVQARQP